MRVVQGSFPIQGRGHLARRPLYVRVQRSVPTGQRREGASLPPSVRPQSGLGSRRLECSHRPERHSPTDEISTRPASPLTRTTNVILDVALQMSARIVAQAAGTRKPETTCFAPTNAPPDNTTMAGFGPIVTIVLVVLRSRGAAMTVSTTQAAAGWIQYAGISTAARWDEWLVAGGAPFESLATGALLVALLAGFGQGFP